LLDDFGFERDIVSNGQVAIEKLQMKSYDIILMDLQMPVMNGFEATDYIRNQLNSKIPIIAISADVTTVDVDKCRAVGMNDYIAKPIDERILYNKIIGLVKKPFMELSKNENRDKKQIKNYIKCIDLNYLSQRTRSNPDLMMEMISLYLKQTPPLIAAMKQSVIEKDWVTLHLAVHKMIPSFSIMGISVEFEFLAKKIQEFARTLKQTNRLQKLVDQLANACSQACEELIEEYENIKNRKR